MASKDLEKSAKEAFVDDDFDLAVDLYTQALDLEPHNANLFADRAQANLKLHNFTDAVSDATKAIELDPSMTKAYLRKGTACFKLEEYQTAKAALEAGLRLAPGDSRFIKLIEECDKCIAEETSELPKKVAPTVAPVTTAPSSCLNADDASGSQPKNNDVQDKPKYRHDFYNSSNEVVITIFAKGIPAERVSVDYGEQMLSVVIDVPGQEKYNFQPRLFGKIIPEKCRYSVLSTKVEVRLAKAEPITWTSLEYTNKKSIPQKIHTPPAQTSLEYTNKKSIPQKIHTPPAQTSQRPSYPSSKSKVDWDKLEAQVKKEEKDEKLDGDAALNKFFREIYSDADEDTRRAMSKSFVESNGTVLSTNWKEVGSKKIEGSAPDGMEMKKWEY